MRAFEIFAETPSEPEAAWALVGDLRRLPEWTDADAVADAPAEPAVGDRFTTRDGQRVLSWVVITSAPHLLEVKTDTAIGRLGIGVSVRPSGVGARIILAGLLDARVPGWRVTMLEVPRLRRRFDDWSTRAARIAASSG